jgi:soluble lytic murein transglycosylase-like protein
MDRIRLTLLAVCALLSTTIEPFADSKDAAPADEKSAGPAISSSADLASSQLDHEVAIQIFNRLSARHTALPERERIALVRTIMYEARAHRLAPSLVVAVIEVESGGYHLAVSHVGAMGLMQLLPSTGEELASRLDIEWKGPDTLFDPNINVRLGTAYLRQLTDQFGSVDTALAAYNWGPGRIGRRLQRGSTVPTRYIEQVMNAVDRNTLASLGRS